MGIGTLREKSLHAALKAAYTLPGDSVECSVNGYVIDIVRYVPDKPQQCIEIQTRNLPKMKQKLIALLDDFPVHVIYPIATERFIRRIDEDGVIVSRRKSPKHGVVYDLFPELVSFPALVLHPGFTLEVVLIHEEETWIDDGQGSWRRKRWSIHNRHLAAIVGNVQLASPADFARLLPMTLPEPFDCKELASALKQPRYIAQKMAFCLREMGVLHIVGKRRNALLYQQSVRGC
jgi:hypothetical protein